MRLKMEPYRPSKQTKAQGGGWGVQYLYADGRGAIFAYNPKPGVTKAAAEELADNMNAAYRTGFKDAGALITGRVKELIT